MSSRPMTLLPESPRELVVVARPDAELRVRDGAVESGAGFDTQAINHLFKSEEISLRPLFGLSERRMKLKAESLRKEAGIDPPDLSVFYRLYAPDELLEELAARIAEEEAVAAAYVKPGAVPAVWFTDTDLETETALPPAVTPDFTPEQRYLNDAHLGGIAAHFAHELPGGRGDGVRIIDVEGAWRFTHDDLKENQGGVVAGVQTIRRLWRDHGTAVIGIFSGDSNGRGVTGICPGANVMGASIFNRPQTGWGTAAAIHAAADKLGRGDIIILELQRPGPAVGFKQQENQFGNIPVEWWHDDMMAIKDANIRGVLVVAAAGNGQQNLHADIYDDPPRPPHRPFPPEWRNPFRRDPIDTGSIIVGAGAPPLDQGNTSQPELRRLDFSNYGNDFLCDAQGWGELVTTCGFGNLTDGGGPDEDFWYTGRFRGTSSAAPMVAGALACVQGILKAAGRGLLDPAAARQLLHNTGTPQLDEPPPHASRRIGNRPDLKQMVAAVLS